MKTRFIPVPGRDMDGAVLLEYNKRAGEDMRLSVFGLLEHGYELSVQAGMKDYGE